MTVLLRTHYLDESDRLAIVDKGRIVATCTPEGFKGGLRGDTIALGLTASPDCESGQRLVSDEISSCRHLVDEAPPAQGNRQPAGLPGH